MAIMLWKSLKEGITDTFSSPVTHCLECSTNFALLLLLPLLFHYSLKSRTHRLWLLDFKWITALHCLVPRKVPWQSLNMSKVKLQIRERWLKFATSNIDISTIRMRHIYFDRRAPAEKLWSPLWRHLFPISLSHQFPVHMKSLTCEGSRPQFCQDGEVRETWWWWWGGWKWWRGRRRKSTRRRRRSWSEEKSVGCPSCSCPFRHHPW